MRFEMTCPYQPCGKIMTLIIDTQGDPDVGMQPAGLEDVQGCIHAEGINSELESGGEEGVKIIWPTFADELNKKLNDHYRAEFEYYSHDEEDTDDDAS